MTNGKQSRNKCLKFKTHLFLLLVEVIDDDTNEEVEREERAKYDKDDEVDVHVDVVLIHWLIFHLHITE